MGSTPKPDDDAQQQAFTPFRTTDAIVEHELVSTPPRTRRAALGTAAVAALLVIALFVFRLDSESELSANQLDSTEPPSTTTMLEPDLGEATIPTTTILEVPLTDVIAEQTENLGVVVWMQPEATTVEVEAVHSALGEERSVSSITYISQEETFAEIEEQFPELPQLLSPTVPADLSSRFEVVFAENAYPSQVVRISRGLPEMPGVRAIQPGNEPVLNLQN